MLRAIFYTVLFFAISLFYTPRSFAMLFQGPQASTAAFQKFAVARNQPTYTQWFLERFRNDEREPHVQVSEMAQRVLQGLAKLSKQDLQDWENVRSVIDLNEADREMLSLLAEQKEAPTERCRYRVLRSDRVSEGCQSRAVAVPAAITKKIGSRDLLVIDGVAFRADQIPRRLTPGAYRWRIISDQFQDVTFVGTASAFAQTRIAGQPWISGDCSNYELRLEDFQVLSQAQVFFDESCAKPGLPPVRTIKSWAKEHETALWITGFVLGGLAVYQMRNKDLVVSGFN